ncbi:TRADD-N-associated membrane domain-containing protein [Streptomyces sp. NPDC002067]
MNSIFASGDFLATVVSALSLVVTLAAALAGLRAAAGSYKRDVAENRKRLHQELRITTTGGPMIDLTVPTKEATTPGEDAESGAGETGARSAEYNTVYNVYNRVDHGSAEEQKAERDEQTFAVLLADYYAHGLTQAQRSSIVSLVFSGFGCLLLFVGVGLAIWKSETTGDLYATMVTNVTGVVTGIVGVLFHRQARRALEHLEGQTRLLRQDMRTERGTRQAIRLVDDVADPALKAKLQAALVLRFTDAALPDVDVSMPGPRSSSAPFADGDRARR